MIVPTHIPLSSQFRRRDERRDAKMHESFGQTDRVWAFTKKADTYLVE